MQNSEWQKVVRLAGYVFIPIGLLILFVFIVVEYQSIKIEHAKQNVATSTKELPQ